MRANPTNDDVIMVKRLVGICAGPLITALTGCMGKGEEEFKAVNKSIKLHHMTVM